MRHYTSPCLGKLRERGTSDLAAAAGIRRWRWLARPEGDRRLEEAPFGASSEEGFGDLLTVAGTLTGSLSPSLLSSL